MLTFCEILDCDEKETCDEGELRYRDERTRAGKWANVLMTGKKKEKKKERKKERIRAKSANRRNLKDLRMLSINGRIWTGCLE